jgi:hypothetical protein
MGSKLLELPLEHFIRLQSLMMVQCTHGEKPVSVSLELTSIETSDCRHKFTFLLHLMEALFKLRVVLLDSGILQPSATVVNSTHGVLTTMGKLVLETKTRTGILNLLATIVKAKLCNQ